MNSDLLEPVFYRARPYANHEWESPVIDRSPLYDFSGELVVTEICTNCGIYRDTYSNGIDEYRDSDDRSIEWIESY